MLGTTTMPAHAGMELSDGHGFRSRAHLHCTAHPVETRPEVSNRCRRKGGGLLQDWLNGLLATGHGLASEAAWGGSVQGLQSLRVM